MIARATALRYPGRPPADSRMIHDRLVVPNNPGTCGGFGQPPSILANGCRDAH